MKPTLFLMVGLPGSGKTTTAKILHALTGAEHLWADKVRIHMFTEPTYSRLENEQLYHKLNEQTSSLLANGKSVIFDTNFNFYEDREKLRNIASDNGARCVVVWVQADKQTAKKRAIKDAELQETRVLGNIPEADFERMVKNLEKPQSNEQVVIVDGTKVSTEYIRRCFDL